MNRDKNKTSIFHLNKSEVLDTFQRCRQRSLELIESLSEEDLNLQADVFTSPPKWHLAHTTWFFETFILKEYFPEYQTFDDQYESLFNSYYNSIGEPYSRSKRGLLTRPTFPQILEYRNQVDRSIAELITSNFDDPLRHWLNLIELGLHHEYQHQELLLTDVKYSLYQNPTFPIFRSSPEVLADSVTDLSYIRFEECVTEIGASEKDGFCYDNESPPHKHFQLPFSLANRPTTNAEYLKFIEDGGYENPNFWIADGWDIMRKEKWTAPLYWHKNDKGEWLQFTLGGLKPLALNEPVCHVSYFEADAFARWSGVRLPTEQMLEIAGKSVDLEGQFYSEATLNPTSSSARNSKDIIDLYGKVWEWTKSPYSSYHGFKTAEGAVGEYNGKFMCNQFVLRGGSCLTQKEQIRPTYRNFFYPHERWQMTGIRLAEEN